MNGVFMSLLLDEKWKEIDGYPRYLISDHGRIKRLKDQWVLTPRCNGKGYLQVGLYKVKSKKRKEFYVHRLVALHFLPLKEGKPHVDHRDNNRSNNNYLNLKWVTPAENNGYRKWKA